MKTKFIIYFIYITFSVVIIFVKCSNSLFYGNGNGKTKKTFKDKNLWPLIEKNMWSFDINIYSNKDIYDTIWKKNGKGREIRILGIEKNNFYRTAIGTFSANAFTKETKKRKRKESETVVMRMKDLNKWLSGCQFNGLYLVRRINLKEETSRDITLKNNYVGKNITVLVPKEKLKSVYINDNTITPPPSIPVEDNKKFYITGIASEGNKLTINSNSGNDFECQWCMLEISSKQWCNQGFQLGTQSSMIHPEVPTSNYEIPSMLWNKDGIGKEITFNYNEEHYYPYSHVSFPYISFTYDAFDISIDHLSILKKKTFDYIAYQEITMKEKIETSTEPQICFVLDHNTPTEESHILSVSQLKFGQWKKTYYNREKFEDLFLVCIKGAENEQKKIELNSGFYINLKAFGLITVPAYLKLEELMTYISDPRNKKEYKGKEYYMVYLDRLLETSYFVSYLYFIHKQYFVRNKKDLVLADALNIFYRSFDSSVDVCYTESSVYYISNQKRPRKLNNINQLIDKNFHQFAKNNIHKHTVVLVDEQDNNRILTLKSNNHYLFSIGEKIESMNSVIYDNTILQHLWIDNTIEWKKLKTKHAYIFLDKIGINGFLKLNTLLNFTQQSRYKIIALKKLENSKRVSVIQFSKLVSDNVFSKNKNAKDMADEAELNYSFIENYMADIYKNEYTIVNYDDKIKSLSLQDDRYTNEDVDTVYAPLSSAPKTRSNF